MAAGLTVARVAASVGRHPGTVRRWIREGELAASWGRGGWRVPRSAVQAMLRLRSGPAGRVGARSGPGADAPSDDGGYGVGEGSDPRREHAMPADLSSFVSLRDAAARVGRSTRTVRRWVANGDLPGAVSLKGRLLILPSDLDRLVVPRGASAGDR